jgi:hypothetical protein
MNVATYPEDMLIALSDLLIIFEEDVVDGKLLLEMWSEEYTVLLNKSDGPFFYAFRWSKKDPRNDDRIIAWSPNVETCRPLTSGANQV